MLETAVVLAAGEGQRLRSVAPLKPLCTIDGETLLSIAIHGLAKAGLRHVVVVLGYGAGEIESHLAAQEWPVRVSTVRTEDHRRPNGSSCLSAEPLLAGEPAVLAMCDHIVDAGIYARMARANASEGISLAVDRRLDNAWVDLDDVTRVATKGDRIVAIGKGLEPYDCFDTGVFAVGSRLFDALRRDVAPSLTQGVQALARQGRAWAVDCGDDKWLDVDDAPAFRKAGLWRKETRAQRPHV